MENSPLNKAHQLQRRAEALIKQKEFDKSIEVHKEATDLLKEALLLSDNPHSIQSIQLQHDYHEKQIDNVAINKLQYEQRQHYLKTQNNNKYQHNLDNETIQNDIIRTIDSHDSLVEILVRRGPYGDEKFTTLDTLDECDEPSTPVAGTKRDIDDSTIIEEFRGLSASLRESVLHLVDLLEQRDKEIKALKSKIYELECEKNKERSKSNNSLKVVTDSSGGTSPFIFSPCSESSPDVNDTRPLPPLAPLEMPNFDFTSFCKSESVSNTIN